LKKPLFQPILPGHPRLLVSRPTIPSEISSLSAWDVCLSAFPKQNLLLACDQVSARD
jgi:hypothetical protein